MFWLCLLLEIFVYRFAKETCDAIVAKCLTGRPKTVEKAQAVFMLWVELEAADVFLVIFFSVYIIASIVDFRIGILISAVDVP